ncbi:MAG: DNA-3-methyladenine glycosylase I [Persicimonas sp.]
MTTHKTNIFDIPADLPSDDEFFEVLVGGENVRIERIISHGHTTPEGEWYDQDDDDDLYRNYHDQEWGFPVAADRRLFEKLCLEGFQAGLSWLTILRKRENFRQAFDGFDFERVAEYDESDVERLMGDAGIVRHRQKIEATINNARCTLEVIEEFGSLARLVWQFEPDADQRPEPITRQVLGSQNLPTSGANREGHSPTRPISCRAPQVSLRSHWCPYDRSSRM